MHYPLANDRRSLQWLANQNAVTLHVWPSRAPRIERPDLCVFDLDPSRDEPEVLRDGDAALRDVLEELGHASWVKTSGSKGFHVVVRLSARATFDDSSALADRVAGILVERRPRELTQAFSKAERDGRIYHRHRAQPRRRDLRRRLHRRARAGGARVRAMQVGRD